MTRTPANPADLGDFIPERDGHALILGPTAGSAVALWSFSNAVGSDLVVLADLPARLTGPRITIAADPSTWDELLETTLGEVARRYSTALTSVQARRLYVVIDLDSLLSTPPALAEPERRLLLERLDELVQIGRAAAVHVLAIATDDAAGYRVSSTLRNTARVFRLPAADTAAGGCMSMGFQVYEDPDHDWRWAGYAVHAECDWDGCSTRIDRGLAYKCEDHGDYVLMLDGEEISYTRFDDEPDADEVWQERDGCGLYFCPDHKARTGEHATVQPKPDSLEWEAHILSDDSWAAWREQHGTRVGVMRARALHTAGVAR